jgi:hypothetical protein
MGIYILLEKITQLLHIESLNFVLGECQFEEEPKQQELFAD